MARSGNGVIALFRNKSRAEQALVELPLLPGGKYKVRSVMSGMELGIFEKADWTRGVPVKFADAAAVEVLEVTAIGA